MNLHMSLVDCRWMSKDHKHSDLSNEMNFFFGMEYPESSTINFIDLCDNEWKSEIKMREKMNSTVSNIINHSQYFSFVTVSLFISFSFSSLSFSTLSLDHTIWTNDQIVSVNWKLMNIRIHERFWHEYDDFIFFNPNWEDALSL